MSPYANLCWKNVSGKSMFNALKKILNVDMANDFEDLNVFC